jgi:hypothetical protein
MCGVTKNASDHPAHDIFISLLWGSTWALNIFKAAEMISVGSKIEIHCLKISMFG